MNGKHWFAALLLALVTVAGAAAPGGVRQKLYVLISNTDEMVVVDVATNQVIKTIKVGALPHGIAAPASQDVLYVSWEGDRKTGPGNGLTVVDPVRDEVIRTYNIFGPQLNEIDITSDGRFVYLPSRLDSVYEVFDTITEKIVTRIPVDGWAHNVVVSPDDRFMYLSAYDRGKLTAEAAAANGQPISLNKKIYVVETATHSVVATIPTGEAPRPIAISPDGRRLYANTDHLDGFVVLDLEARKLIHRVTYSDLTEEERAIPSRSHGIGVTPDQTEVWSTDVNRGIVHVFDITREPPVQIGRVNTGASPLWVTFTPDGKTVYVSNGGDGTVSVIDVAARKEKTRIDVGNIGIPKRILVLSVPVESGVSQ